MTSPNHLTGGRLCGQVRYRVTGPLRPVIMCHCGQYRRWTGHFVAATTARLADFSFERTDAIA